MNSITQELINVTKNIIEKKFFEECRNLLKPMTNEYLYCCDNNKYDFFPFRLREKLNCIIIKVLEKSIPKIDEYFLNSNHKKKFFYHTTRNKRTIITIFGELSFERYYYTSKDKKDGFYLINKLFNFEKYTTYDVTVRSLLIDKTVKINANVASSETSLIFDEYNNYLNNDKFNNVPRQTIYYWIKKWNIPKIEYDLIENINDLYVMVDEKWIHEQIHNNLEEKKKKHNYIMSKCFVTFTGKITKNNRSKLINRHVYLTSCDKPWKKFMDSIYNIYDFESIKNIYLLSDSGTWIIAGKGELKLFSNNKVTVNTCEFHVKEYINRITGNKDFRKALSKIIYELKDKKVFVSFTNYLLSLVDDCNKRSRKRKHVNYILKHWKTILNMNDRKIKSSMEAHISHCVANNFGSRPKGYSKNNIERYLKLEEAKQNGINIMKLYLNSYNKNRDYIYQKNDVSFSLFEKNTSILPILSSYNPISRFLHAVAYNTNF